MKRKLRRRNQRWLSVQLRRAYDEHLPLSFFLHFPAQRALVCNGMRLERRGRLKPDWQRALFHKGWGEVPMVGPDGSIYWFISFEKEQVPCALKSLWIED